MTKEIDEQDNVKKYFEQEQQNWILKKEKAE